MLSPAGAASRAASTEPRTTKDRTHWLYIAVIAAIASVVLGAAAGLLSPEFGKSLKPPRPPPSPPCRD